MLEKTKKSYPLGNHMPGYFIIPSFTARQAYLSFEDELWDGSITPSSQSKRVFSHIYAGKIHRRSPRSVVTIQAVRGPAGRVGLRRGDVVTHINEVEWVGGSEELVQHIHSLCEAHTEQNVSVTVNATPEMSDFLHARKQMMERANALLT